MKVFVVVHNTGSEGIDAEVFGGEDAKQKAWACVAGRVEDYLENRNRLSDERTEAVERALKKGDFELAWSEWATGQDEDDEVSFYDQESISVEEKEVQ